MAKNATDLLFGDKSDANVISNVVESVDSVATTSVSWTCPSVDFDGPSYRYLVIRSTSMF